MSCGSVPRLSYGIMVNGRHDLVSIIVLANAQGVNKCARA